MERYKQWRLLSVNSWSPLTRTWAQNLELDCSIQISYRIKDPRAGIHINDLIKEVSHKMFLINDVKIYIIANFTILKWKANVSMTYPRSGIVATAPSLCGSAAPQSPRFIVQGNDIGTLSSKIIESRSLEDHLSLPRSVGSILKLIWFSGPKGVYPIVRGFALAFRRPHKQTMI